MCIALFYCLSLQRHLIPHVSRGNAGIYIPDAKTKSDYAKLNALLPSCGQTIAAVRFSYLLDFSRSNVFIADFPGSAGPPNGWPVGTNNAGQLKQYLLQNNIHCLAYSDLSFDRQHLPEWFRNTLEQKPGAHEHADYNGPSQWNLDQVRATMSAVDQFHQLATTQYHIYDSEHMHVLDLSCGQAEPRCQHQQQYSTSTNQVIAQ